MSSTSNNVRAGADLDALIAKWPEHLQERVRDARELINCPSYRPSSVEAFIIRRLLEEIERSAVPLTRRDPHEEAVSEVRPPVRGDGENERPVLLVPASGVASQDRHAPLWKAKARALAEPTEANLDALIGEVDLLWLTRRDQPEPPAPRAWRDALADLVDVCYAEGSGPSWRVCQVCDTEHRPEEARPGDETHRTDCVVRAAEKLLTAWTKSQSVSLATRRDAPQE